MSGGKAPRRKGNAYEVEFVNYMREGGLIAKRVPLSGATNFAKGDVQVTTAWDETLTGELKRRKNLPQWIEDALGDHDFMAMRADHGETMVVLRIGKFRDLLQ